MSLITEFIAALVGGEIADEVSEVIEETVCLEPEEHYQRYWWLLVDERELRTSATVYRRTEPEVWPPFFGHRVPLGGDGA